MLLESLSPLQLKSNVLGAFSGVAANGVTIILPNNPRRHSLIITINADATFVFSGTVCTLPSNVVIGAPPIVMNWDNYGESLSLISSITSGATCTQFVVIETYREEVTVGQ